MSLPDLRELAGSCPALRADVIEIECNMAGSKNQYQNGTLVSGNMDQNLRNPSCLILSHTHLNHRARPSPGHAARM